MKYQQIASRAERLGKTKGDGWVGTESQGHGQSFDNTPPVSRLLPTMGHVGQP